MPGPALVIVAWPSHGPAIAVSMIPSKYSHINGSKYGIFGSGPTFIMYVHFKKSTIRKVRLPKSTEEFKYDH